MKALSVMQPWATLLVSGAKRIETRSWQTSYRGPFLIHASRRRVPSHRLAGLTPYHSGWHARHLPRGVILGYAVLVDCLPAEALDGTLDVRERALGRYGLGMWAWLLERPRPLARPFAWRGALGVFDLDDQYVRPHLTAAESADLYCREEVPA